MKKIIALLLALIMTFSLGTVAFATDVDAPAVGETETTAPAEGEDAETEESVELEWLLDLPFWTLGPASWFAKVALKLVAVYVKVAALLGVIESTGILDMIQELINNSQDGEAEETTAAPEAETTAQAAA